MTIRRREFLLRTPPLLAAMTLGACTDVGSAEPREGPTPRSKVAGLGGAGVTRRAMPVRDAAATAAGEQHPAADQPPVAASPSPQTQPTATAGDDALGCGGLASAYLLELGANSADMRAALVAAGFEVQSLALEDSPGQLNGLIAIPAYASDDPAYATYMAEHAADLYTFVDGANVLLQLTQAASSEPSPPFLPTTHTARRQDGPLDLLRALSPNHPLLANIGTTNAQLNAQAPGIAANAFVDQDGFEPILADDSGQLEVLLEGAYGQGRLLLAALAFAPGVNDASDQLREQFFANLLTHVQNVCARAAPELTLPESEAATSFTPGSSMIAVLPDTQVYSLRLPGLFNAQTSWLRNNAQRLDIRYALQLGDITNNNTAQEWERAAAAMSLLDGVVPLALVPGNHDYGPSGDASTRKTRLNDYFPFASAAAMPTFGGAYEEGRLDNSYHLFSIGGRDFVLLALEWGPRDEVIAWGNEVMDRFPEREGILATHAYLNNDSRRYDINDSEHAQRFNPHEYRTPGGVNDGEELWQKLVRNHRFVMTLNGHVLGSGTGYLASVTDRGNTCHQMLSNFQMREQGGEGYLRILEFLPDGRTVNVFTYSPLYDKFLAEDGQSFSIAL